MVVSNLYITIGTGARVATYDFTTLQPLWDINLETQVVSLKFQQKWVIATTTGKIWQIGPEGVVMSYATTHYALSKAGAITTQNGYEAIAWSEGGNMLQRWVLDDTYDCDASLGCQCIQDYCFTDASYLVCNYTGVLCVNFTSDSSLNTTINATNLNRTTTNNTSLNGTTKCTTNNSLDSCLFRN